MRIDKYLTDKHGFSREYAKELIEKGFVLINGAAPKKAGKSVCGADSIELLAGERKYVSRGGLKLEAALKAFGIDIRDKACLDIGASTGGFTDCMLNFGARSVCSVDVGSGQLAEKLRNDNRVRCIENMNIKDFHTSRQQELFSFLAVDLSFISLTKVINSISGLLEKNGEAVFLVKPQFEAGRGRIGKNGVVTSLSVHQEIIGSVLSCCTVNSLLPKNLIFSPITGQEGNTEYLLYIMKE